MISQKVFLPVVLKLLQSEVLGVKKEKHNRSFWQECNGKTHGWGQLLSPQEKDIG
jgi:hypothetical protein